MKFFYVLPANFTFSRGPHPNCTEAKKPSAKALRKIKATCRRTASRSSEKVPQHRPQKPKNRCKGIVSEPHPPFPELRAPCNQAGTANPYCLRPEERLPAHCPGKSPLFASDRRTMRQCTAKTASLPDRKDRFPGIEPDKRPIGAKYIPAPAKAQNVDFQRKKPRNLA